MKEVMSLGQKIKKIRSDKDIKQKTKTRMICSCKMICKNLTCKNLTYFRRFDAKKHLQIF